MMEQIYGGGNHKSKYFTNYFLEISPEKFGSYNIYPLSLNPMKQKISTTHTPTQEEKEIVSLLVDGYKGNNLAAKLGMTESALAAKLAIIRKKYGAVNSIELAAIFLRNNIIR